VTPAAPRSRRRTGRTGRDPGLARRLLVLLVAAAVLPWWVPGPTASAATAPAALSVTTLSPAVATAGAELRVAGELTNTGKGRLRDIEIRLRLSDSRLNSRAELAAVAEGRTASRDGSVVVSASLADLPVGQSAGFSLARPLDEVDALQGLTEFGVYVLGVEVLASRSSDFGRVAIVRTLLPWIPAESDFQPAGYSWLWPLVARPTRLADGTFTDESLAAEMGPTGRLTRLVDAGARLDEEAALSWAVDPELLAAAEDMADVDGYLVRAADGSPVPGGGGGLAARWLEQVREATLGADVIALPYGDPDLTAITRAGLVGDVSRARRDGLATVDRLLPSAVDLPGTVWPTDGYLNGATLDVLRGTDADTVVLDGRAVPTEIDLSYTPSGRADVGSRSGQVTGLLADPGLADLLRRPGQSTVLGAQRFLAETAMITSELPSTGTERAILVMPPRRWNPLPDFLDLVVQGFGGATWAAPVSLPELAGREPPEVDRAPLRYPRQQRRRELPGTYLSAPRGMHTSINEFADVLTDPDALIPQLNRAVLLLESSWWRDREERKNRLALERAWLAERRDLVAVQPARLTFSSRSGNIPVTVANGLDQAVRVSLRLDPRTTRIRLDKSTRTRTIGPQRKQQVEFPAISVAAGDETVDASLHTPTGALYGQPVQLRITITNYGTVALYITVGAAAVLFLTAGVRVLRRVLAARQQPVQP